MAQIKNSFDKETVTKIKHSFMIGLGTAISVASGLAVSGAGIRAIAIGFLLSFTGSIGKSIIEYASGTEQPSTLKPESQE